MKRLKLALLSSGLGYTLRGVEQWMVELAVHLPDTVDVELWSGGPPPATRRVARRLLGVDRESRWMRGAGWGRRYTVEQLSVLPQTVALLRMRGIDIVYCGDPYLSWHLKRLRPVHGAKVVFMNGMRLSPTWARGFDGVHLLAPGYLEEARSLLGGEAGNFFAVPHFVDVERFAPPTPAERRAARERFGVGEEEFVVLTIGPVGTVSRKRLDFLAREVAGAGAPAVLLSAGGDEEGAEGVRREVVDALGGRARFLGRVEREEVHTLYHAADVYSLGSLAEPFSIAILEALASGLPVVHHADPVMRWQTGGGGVAVSMETPGEAAGALRRLRDDPAWRAGLGAAARALAESRYSAPEVCSRLVESLERVHRSERAAA